MSSYKFGHKPHTNSSIPLPRSSPRAIPQPRQPPNIDSISYLPSYQPEHILPRPSTDHVKTYCTEDTPAILSHAGSNSDLSLLSISNDNRSGRKGDYLSDDSSNLSGKFKFSSL